MTLETIENSFKRARELAIELDTKWLDFKIPESLRQRFLTLWTQKHVYQALSKDGLFRVYTSLDRSENVSDLDLALAVVSYPFWKNLHDLRIQTLELVSAHGITNFKNDFKSKVTLSNSPNSQALLNNAIDEDTTLPADQKITLKAFISDSEQFHGIKGIGRDDFAQPAICKAIEKRVDRFGIADQIAAATDEDFYNSIRSIVLALSPPNDDVISLPFSATSLPSAFQNFALAESLLAKPFTILTGASGTGKTKLAEALTTHLGNTAKTNSAIVAVGADWTDNRNVLGFVNYLRIDDDSGNPTYQTTPVLDLLLRASDDPKTPYFLILDEMNLSHVERYFSDFLSVMEQKDGHFDLHSEGPNGDNKFTLPISGDSSVGVPQKLAYPQNLFVIGTVNIDETTYMFSPKVLDRANVIEFKVDETGFETFLKNPGGYPETPVADPGVAEGFLELAHKARKDDGIDPIIGDTAREIRTHLMDLFRMMQEARFEFAYRTGHEIFRYLRVSQHLAEDEAKWKSEDWKQDLDTQILQKILPKLHGSIGRISPLISALAHYCETGKKDEVPTLRNLVQSPFDRDTALFPRSAEKLREMAKTLSVEQFVSFIS